MLVELAIRDLALFERCTLELGGGLNVLTGETGAGKSLTVDALELLLGRRARGVLVRKGAERARVEGRFELALEGYGELVAEWLRANLPEALEEHEEQGGDGPLELVLTRTVGRDGRSRAHVDHRPVTQRLLRELAGMLVEVHGQHEHQRLFDPSEQLRLLDDVAGTRDALAGYRERRARWLELAERLGSLETGEAERLQRVDFLRYQVDELAEADPSVEEREALDAERAVLRHAADLRSELGGLAHALAESDDAALDVVRRAERVVDAWSARVEELAAPAEALREAGAQLEEAARALGSFLDGVDVDPARLDEVEERLAALERLERKHGTDTAGLVRRRQALEEELAALDGTEGDRDRLAADVDAARASVEEAACRLGRARRRAVPKLVRAVERGLSELGLERAAFDVRVEPHAADAGDARRRLGPNGADSVEFLLAANPGEDAAPLRAVASGGEAARILLALRGALAVRRSTPTLVFDEVDAGVGGRLGPRVAAHLEALGEHHQVLCVTHLPAIAARATRHLRVEKEVSRGRTRTRVAALAGDPRVDEIADMIAGGREAETARAEARRLLQLD